MFGKVRLDGITDSVSIKVSNSEKVLFEKKTTAQGDYEIFLNYGENYTLTFAYKDYTTLQFMVFLKLPVGVKQCCFTPLNFTFHLFKPDGVNDKLFQKPLVEAKYIEKFKNFNYDIDVDFIVQKKIIDAEVARRKLAQDAVNYKAYQDSMLIENRYMDLINRGNLLYGANQFTLAKDYFVKAHELKPTRRYPKYKLEDIQTELEIFNKTADSLGIAIDSIMPREIKIDSVKALAVVAKPMTQEQLMQKLMNDLKRNISSAVKDTKQLRSALSYTQQKIDVNNNLSNEKVVLVVDSKPVETKSVEVKSIEKIENVKKTDTVPVISPVEVKIPKEVVVIEQKSTVISKPEEFDPVVYQDSLAKIYPTTKTIEVEEDMYKKVTRVIINKDNFVTIYLKVEHKWGATYYFIDRTPFDPENISSSFFDFSTNVEN
ncbi:MAG: hypothetical protein IPO21_21275 [Bacteroidales bacterium]|nr:hypothetical protein [Bacteroidales bacterium]